MATVLISARDIYGFLEPVIIGKKSFLIKDEDILCDFKLASEIMSSYNEGGKRWK